MRLAIILFVLPLLCGCVGTVRELKKPPFPYVLIQQVKGVGIDATIPNQAGGSYLRLRLGWFSESFHMIPCATNKVYLPPISETFKLGNEISLSPSTSIVDDLQTGYEGTTPPPARFQRLFDPSWKTDKDDKKAPPSIGVGVP